MITKIDNVQSNPSFGMALHIPENKQIASVLGRKSAEAAEKASPMLRTIADNVDIFVKMEAPVKTDLKALKMVVKPLGKSEEEQSSILVSDDESIFTADTLANYLVKTAQLLKSKFELPQKVTPEEMIDPNFDAGNNVNRKFYLYIAQNRQGYIDDLKKDLKGVDDRFIAAKLILGHIAEPLSEPVEFRETDLNYDNRRMYYLTSSGAKTIDSYGIIKPEYSAQFKDEVKNNKF